MAEVLGYSGTLALLGTNENAVVVDTSLNLVVDSGLTAAMKTKRKWGKKSTCEITDAARELADSALSSLEIKVLTASGRLYTIPITAQKEAQKALQWHKEHKRGGTPVGLNTARTLAKGGQIGIEKVRHIAKYFPRHEVDKKADGYQPGEKGFPSNGRIAWALWGGNSARRWAQAIVDRENKKAVTADGYALPGYSRNEDAYSVEHHRLAELDSFTRALNSELIDPEEQAPEFMVRVRLDGSGIDRLYKIDIDNSVYVWDNGYWDNLASLDGDVYTYDKALDDPYDLVEKDYFTIDPSSAIALAAMFQQAPFDSASISQIDEFEAYLAQSALPEIDWELVDYAVTAASTPAPAAGDSTAGDGNYTPQERSKNAGAQVRDATGRFAKSGNQVNIKGGKPGVITSIDSNTKMATVKHADGTSSIVPANLTTKAANVTGIVPAPTPQDIANEPLDTSGILGEPRTPINQPTATLPGTLPAITAKDLHDIISNWPAWVQSQRSAASPAAQTPTSGIGTNGKSQDSRTPYNNADLKSIGKSSDVKNMEKLAGKKLTLNAYDHPLLKDWLSGKGKDGSNNSMWYQPVTSAASAPGAPMTPDNSDVQPLYMALVSPDDPRAVMDVVSIVPASTTSTEPVTFTRENGKWVSNPEILQDLRSATPPPVVPLDSESLTSVLEQADGKAATASAFSVDSVLMVLFGPGREAIEAARAESELEVLFAGARPPSAHNIHKNKGNAEKLRLYWTKGKGAAKIRWGVGGDWKRCVRYLSKYLGTRAKGYCQLRHKEATGMYTSTHAKLIHGGRNTPKEFIMEEVLTKNYGTPTKITDEDMLMSIDDVYAEHDKLYDHSWTPEPEIHSLLQDEACQRAMTAAGLPLQHVGNAERLRAYWTVGKGGAKIRWNTPGDWTRCVRHLSKFMGDRAKGYCALRHHEMDGMWPGDKQNLKSFSADVIDISTMNARAKDALERVGIVAAGSLTAGSKFAIPLVIPEGVLSGDGRMFRKDSVEIRELPIPLLWQIKTGEGHQGSVVVGRIDSMERTGDGIGNAYGVFDSGAYGREAERLIRHGFIRGVSADMDKFEATQIDDSNENEDGADKSSESKDEKIEPENIVVNRARVMAVTIVPKPAFQECKIVLVDDNPIDNNQEDSMIPNGIYVDDADALDAEALVACGFVAGAIPMTPPTGWFENPKLDKPTPLTVDDDGRVYGHIAAWNVDHIGMANGTRPPRSKSNYAYFHTGVVRTEDGSDVPVGQLTLAGGHASIEASAYEAAKHYDDTASAVADVHAGEDQHGIWVAGALRPGAEPEQIRSLRASAPSGDWRPIRGSLELVAVCQVNVPGFPIARARVASGQVMALVAAGAATLAKLKHDPVADLTSRIKKLEQFGASKDLASKAAELAARVHASAEFADISEAQRKKLAEKGQALPDGSYPIRNVTDLKNAVQSYGRAAAKDKAKVRKHISKRANELKRPDLIPDNWKSTSVESITASAEDLKARVAAAQEALGKAFAAEPVDDGRTKYTFKTQPRDSKGKFRQVLAVLRDNLGKAGLTEEAKQAERVQELRDAGQYDASDKAAAELLDTVQRISTGALSNNLESVKLAAMQLGTAVSNAPLPFGVDTKRMRFSDLPAPLQKLTADMMDRVEKRIGKKESDQATKDLRSYISGSDLYSQSEVSAQLSKMLRLLT